MEQFVALIRERHWENAKWTDYFVVENSENPEQNFRDAVKEYLLSEDGKEAIEATSEDFNWGDSVTHVPDEIWNKHKIRPVYSGDKVVIGNQIEIIVDQDEVLIPQEYFETQEV